MSAESTDAVTVGRWRRGLALLRESLAGHRHDYTKGAIGRAVLLLAIPMMLEMAMESVFAVVDIFWVANLGAPAVAAVGLTEAVLTLLYAAALGLGMAATAIVARRIGANEPDAAAQVAGQTFWISVGTALVVAAIGVPLAPRILEFMGAETDVIAGGAGYTRLMLGGSITILSLFLLNAVLRGAGNAALAMRVLWLANGINIVLGPCLIYGVGPFPKLGVAGAAVATNIGRGIGALFALYWLTNGRGRVVLQWRHLRLVTEVLLSLLRVAAGGVLQFVIATSSYIGLMLVISGYGSAAIAGYTIAMRVMMFMFLPAWGLSSAAATLVGQNLGARAPERAERSVWVATKYNVLFLERGRRRARRVAHDTRGDLHERARRARLRRQRAAPDRPRLPALRRRHHDGAGVQRRGRHEDADVDERALFLAAAVAARVRTRASRAAGADRRVRGRGDRRIAAVGRRVDRVPARGLEAQGGLTLVLRAAHHARRSASVFS